jgi:uncharacterized coiled-coil protein SlyX
VADDFDLHIQLDQQPTLHRRGVAPSVLVSVGVLAVIAGAFAYVWLNDDGLVQAISSAAQPAAVPVVASDEETVNLKDFQSFQRKNADSLQSAAQDIAAQKADLNRLSDQVSALSAKIDALQSAAAPPQPAVLPQPPVTAARKKPTAPKTTGPISVGGAPLPPTPPDKD